MTKLADQKSSILFPSWRRHTDSLGLWVAIATGSVVLHVLVLWLLRSYLFNLLRQQQYLSNVVPIEVIEITSPRVGSKTSSQASPKPTSQKPTSNFPQEPTPSLSTIDEQSAIALTDKKIPPSPKPNSLKLDQQRSQTSTIGQKIATLKPQATIQPKSTPKVISPPSPQVNENPQPSNRPFSQISENRQPIPSLPKTTSNPNISTPNQDQSLSDQLNQASKPADTTTNFPPGSFPSPNQSPDIQPSPGLAIPLPGQPSANISLGNPTPLPTLDTSIQPSPQSPANENQTGGSLVATWNAIPRETMVGLIQKTGLRQNLLPEILAEPQGKNIKNLAINVLNSEPDVESVDLLAFLTIDENGKLIARDRSGQLTVEIINITPAKLANKKSEYQQIVADIFQQVSFTPARNQDGSKPPLSNLLVHIKIQRL